MRSPAHNKKPVQILRGFFVPTPAVGGRIARPQGAQSGHIVPKIGARSAQNRRAAGAHTDPIRGALAAETAQQARPQGLPAVCALLRYISAPEPYRGYMGPSPYIRIWSASRLYIIMSAQGYGGVL